MLDDLEILYRSNFRLHSDHKYSLSEVENMLPFEREIHIGMLKERQDQLAAQHQAQQPIIRGE